VGAPFRVFAVLREQKHPLEDLRTLQEVVCRNSETRPFDLGYVFYGEYTEMFDLCLLTRNAAISQSWTSGVCGTSFDVVASSVATEGRGVGATTFSEGEIMVVLDKLRCAFFKYEDGGINVFFGRTYSCACTMFLQCLYLILGNAKQATGPPKTSVCLALFEDTSDQQSAYKLSPEDVFYSS
jgi:hypothetical protein